MVDNYKDLTFATAPVDGAPVVGDIKNFGTTYTTATNDTGRAYFAIGTVGDTAYNATGDIAGTISVAFGSGSLNVTPSTTR